MNYHYSQQSRFLTTGNLLGDHSPRMSTNLDFTRHLTPGTRITEADSADIIAAGTMNVILLSHLLAETARHHPAAVQQWHTETPAKLRHSLTLHTGEAPKGTATSAHIRTAVTDACSPGPRGDMLGRHNCTCMRCHDLLSGWTEK